MTDQARTSWTPVDLGPVVSNGGNLEPPPTMLTRTDGKNLLYARKIHWFAGEPESAKGWLSLWAAVERIQAGEHVLYLDFEDEATTVVSRLLALGLEGEAIIERFHYIRPDEPLSDVSRGQIHEDLSIYEPTLAVLDGMTDALALHGIDLRDNTEVANWMRDLPMMLRDSGLAVVITDHVIKDSESQGRWSIGAQHKLAKTDVQYRLKVKEPLGRGLVGRVLIRVEKDRPGHVRALAEGRTVAEVIASSGGDGEMELTIQPIDQEQAWRPTFYMEKVSRELEAEPGLSKNKVRETVGGKATYIDQALEVLVDEEWVEVRQEGTAHRHYVLRPYRESEDPNRVPDRVPTVSPEPPGDHSTDRVPVSPPIGDTGHGRGDTASPNLGTRSNSNPPSDPPPSFDDRVERTSPRSTSHPRLTEQQYAEVWRSRQARKNNKPIRAEDLERLRDVVEEDDGGS